MLWRQVYRSSLTKLSSSPSSTVKTVPLSTNILRFAAPKVSEVKMVHRNDPMEYIDPIQEALLNEVCILVDDNDRKIGTATKKDCHLLLDGLCKLHRAFSVFLFDQNGRLLLQQRSDAKITFPDMFTNTCCSHPLAIDDELDEKHALGVKRAAKRKLEHELGISQSQLHLGDFHYLTRIHYNAASDGKWGEHEIDYILFVQKDVTMKVNENEVKSVRYVTPEELRQMIEDDKSGKLKLTPWFRLICQGQLFEWWKNLDNLKQFEDHHKVHRL